MPSTSEIGWRARKLAPAAIAFIVLLAGCGTHANDSSGPGQPNGSCTVTFGADTELSGPSQIYGVTAMQGAQAAAKAINQAGGVKVGNKTCQFNVLGADNKSDPSQVFTAAQQVIDARAVAALAPDLDDTVAYQAWSKNKIVTFVVIGETASNLEADATKVPLAIALIPFQLLQHESYLKQALAAAPTIKKVAILWPADQAGQQVHDQFAQAVKNVGLDLVADVSYPDSTSDYSSFITKAKASQPDLLITEYSSEQSMAIMQQAVPLNAARYYMSETATAETVQATKGLENATVFLPTFAPTYSSAMTLPNDHPEVIFGNGPAPEVPGAAIVMYYAAWLIKQAVEKSGSTDGATVFDALIGQSYDGPFGNCSITKDRFLQCNTAFVVVQGSKVTAQEFSSPYSDKPTGTYDCVAGKCTPVGS